MEWLKFAEKYSDVCVYAIAVVPQGIMDEFGKALPEASQRDTGARGATRVYSDSIGAANRRRQRARRHELAMRTPDQGYSQSNQSTPSIASILEVALQAQSQQSALQFLASQGNIQAIEKLTAIAFGSSGGRDRGTSSTSTPSTSDVQNRFNFDDIEEYEEL